MMDRPNGADHSLTERELTSLARQLVNAQTTMTLATAKGDQAWAAPVYYVFVRSAFYFLSSPTSRHIKEALQSGQASSTIYTFASTWKEIRGLQMSGCIATVKAGLEAIQVLRAYLKKYPFTKDFFQKEVTLDLESLAQRFGVKLYKFTPNLVYYLDNRIRFAFRVEVKI
jgi:uncharacterized protein YhbP (UPF0306 family)